MDAIDREILSALQADGRLTVTDLAGQVSLSLSSCHRRLRALEQSGTIRGYRAVLDQAAVGLGFEGLVFVIMATAERSTVSEFEAAVAAIPNVLQAHRLFGETDYQLRVVERDLTAFQTLYDERLATLPGVGRLISTIVMKRIVEDRPLPL